MIHIVGGILFILCGSGMGLFSIVRPFAFLTAITFVTGWLLVVGGTILVFGQL